MLSPLYVWVEQENSSVESCCLGAGEIILRLLFSPNTVDKQMYTVW